MARDIEDRAERTTVLRSSPGAQLPGRNAWLAFALVIVSTVGLLVVPFLLTQRLNALRAEITGVIDPARIQVTTLQLALAREGAANRAYLLTGDPDHLEEARAARVLRSEALDELGPLFEELGPQAQRQLAEFRDVLAPWDEDNLALVVGELSPEEFRANFPEQVMRYEQVLVSAARLDPLLVALAQQNLDRRQATQRLANSATTVLVLLGLLAVALVYRLTRRFQKRAVEEVELRETALVLTEAVAVEEVLRRIAESAAFLSEGEASYIERIDPDVGDVEVVAAAGGRAPPVRTRVAYPGSLTEEVIDSGRPEIVRDVTRDDRPIAKVLAETCDGCSALVVPLISEASAEGALVLLRSDRMFREEDILQPRILGVLASLALRRALLLERAERRADEEASLRQELSRVMESRERLMRGFSHDVKNPLGAADGYLELVETGITGQIDGEAKESIQRARRSITAALDLIRDLLEMARAEAGTLPINREPTDVRRLAVDVAEEHHAAAEAGGLTLHTEVPDTVPEIETDGRRVYQILGNLLSNAVKYTPSGGRITVRVDLRSGPAAPGPGRWLTVDVVDTGPGIAPEEQDEIFHEFTRLASSDEGKGAGVGLAISKRLARALGGDLTVESEVRQGSTFTLWLPFEPGEAAGEAVGKKAGEPS